MTTHAPTHPATTARGGAARRWLFGPLPLARIAWLRLVIYLFVVYDATRILTDPIPHGDVPEALYQPVWVREVLQLPAPSPAYVRVLLVVVLVSALVAATGRLPRLAGAVCALAMIDWISNAFSYSKVDHDHFALVVALLVLPTLPRARFRDTRGSEAAGWAIRTIQMAAIAVYFLSACAKMRFGTWGWANGSTLIWALTRRPHGIGPWLASHEGLTHALQWLTLCLEFATPVILWLRGRALALAVCGLLGFHATTYYLLQIHFLPLVVCLTAFLPLERLPGWWDRVVRPRLSQPDRRRPQRA